MATGMPVAFCFLAVNLIWVPFIWPGEAGMMQIILGTSSSLVRFTLLPLPLFILMGEVIFQTGIAPFMIEAVDKWLGNLPGRLGLVAVAGGALFSTLTGASVASVAMLGETLVPEMESRGYRKSMSLGPILGSGGLAIMIPPSGLAVLLGTVGEISIGRILIGIIVPGVLMAILYASYIILRCKLQPSIAPAYEVRRVNMSEKLISTAKYILPAGFIIFMVVGVMFAGIATPTGAAATGALSTFILAAFYKKLNWVVTKKALLSTLQVSVMVLMIISASKIFSQILSFSGAASGLAEFAIGLPIAPIFIIIGMQIILLILGMFMDVASIMMITLPIFVPIVNNLGFDLVWFAAIFLLNIEMATTTPPFGLSLFTMKGVAPSNTTMGDIYRAGLPFLGCDLVVMVLILVFPPIALMLPGLMR